MSFLIFVSFIYNRLVSHSLSVTPVNIFYNVRAKGYFTPKHLQLPQFLFLLYYTQIYRNVHSNNLHAPVCQTLHRIVARILLFSSFSVMRLKFIPDFPEAMEFGLLFLPEHQHYIYNQPQNRKKHSCFQVRRTICQAYLM